MRMSNTRVGNAVVMGCPVRELRLSVHPWQFPGPRFGLPGYKESHSWENQNGTPRLLETESLIFAH